MFEIHYHMLFGVDDGPRSLEDSLELAKASVAEGVTHVVCTPHANDHHRFDPEVNRKRLEELNTHLAGTLTLGLGCDFHLSYENVVDLRSNPTKYTINGHQYLLVEFPDFGIPNSITETLHQMVTSGLIPIITHPERNPTLVSHPERMAEWIRCGCLVQITAASLDGRFGQKAREMSHIWLRKNWVHFIASDAHSVAHRPPSMARAHQLLTKSYDRDTADRLCVLNPGAVFAGEPLGAQPEPVGLTENQNAGKPSFLGRLFKK